jgi:hypothetical protein
MSFEDSFSAADTAMTCLKSKSRRAFRDVSCEYDSGTIILRGRSASYYDKQVAQETVRGVGGVNHVVNEIEVASNATSIPTTCAPSRPIPVRLRSLESKIPNVEFVLTEPRVLVGRAESADVRILDPCVSRYHCEIGAINGTLWVRDLGSANGLFVNGLREPQSHLMPGDRLTIGEASFRVEYDRLRPKCYEDVLT